MRTLTRAQAVGLRGKATAKTQNETFIVIVELPDGSQADAFVKPRLPSERYALEWLGAALADALGLSVPESFAVDISPEFVASLQPGDAAAFSPGSVVFGARRATNVVRPTHPLISRLHDNAIKLLLFDVLVQNADRRADNPNFFVGADALIAYDHELIGADLLDIIPQPPELVLSNHWCRAEVVGTELPRWAICGHRQTAP